MSGAINLRVLLPMMALFLPADLAAAPPNEGVKSLFPLLSDEECWRKLPRPRREAARRCRRGRGRWPVRCPGRRPRCCNWISCIGRVIRSGRCSAARCDGSPAMPIVVNTAWPMPRPTCGVPASTRRGSVP